MTTTDESKPQSPESLLGPILDGLAQLQLTIMRQTLLDQPDSPGSGDCSSPRSGTASRAASSAGSASPR